MTSAPDKPRISRNRRRGDTFGRMSRLAGAVALVIAIAVIFNIAIHKLERSPPVQPEYDVNQKTSSSTAASEGKTAAPVRGIVDLESKRPLIEAALRGFFEASSVETKLTFSRHADRVRPLMQHYYLSHTLRPYSFAGLGTCLSVGEKGYRLGYIQAQFSHEDPISILVEEGEDGQFLADWESLVRYSEMDWADFLQQKPTTPTLLRVLASQASPDNVDGLEWLELSSPGSDRLLVVSFDRQDPKFQPLIDQLQLGGWKKVPLTLRVCYSKSKSNANAAHIVGSEGKGWLILN